MLIADDEPSTWVQGAREALGKDGLNANSASGYKSYYDEKKAENPSWPGVPLPKDAAYVIIVGPSRRAEISLSRRPTAAHGSGGALES